MRLAGQAAEYGVMHISRMMKLAPLTIVEYTKSGSASILSTLIVRVACLVSGVLISGSADFRACGRSSMRRLRFSQQITLTAASLRADPPLPRALLPARRAVEVRGISVREG